MRNNTIRRALLANIKWMMEKNESSHCLSAPEDKGHGADF
jgi:hypothetical protein